MLALQRCAGAASPEELVGYFDALPVARRTASLEQVRDLRAGADPWRAWADESVVLAVVGAADDPREAYDLLLFQHPVRHRVDALDALLERRTPNWRARLTRAVLRDEFGEHLWWLVRHQVRAGLSPRPEEPGYLGKLLGGLAWAAHQSGITLAAALREDPGLLEGEVWEALAVPDLGRHLSPDWQRAVVELARSGDLDRPRLLGTAMTALVQERRAPDQRPFLDLLARLVPDAAELDAHRDALLAMTASPTSSVVAFAQAGLTTLLQAGRLGADPLVALRAPLERPERKAALAQLALLRRALERHPDRGADLGPVVALALDHERADVRDRAHKLLLRHAPDHLPDPLPEATAPAVPTTPGRPAFEPVADAAELVDLLLELLAHPGSGLDVERAYDGALRFRHELPAAGRTALDRATRRNRGTTSGLRPVVRALVEPWSDPRQGRWRETVYDTDEPGSGAGPRRLAESTWLRAQQVAVAVRSPVTRLLAVPSRVDGSLSVDDLRERLEATRGEPAFRTDVGTAAFRVPPEQYAEVEALRSSPVGAAVADAVARIAAHRPHWEAEPWSDAPTPGTPAMTWPAPTVGVVWRDGAPPPSADSPAGDFVGSVLDRHDVALHADVESRDPSWQTGEWPLLLPHHRELLAAHAFPRLALAAAAADTTLVHLVRGMGGGRDRIGPVACAALALALSATSLEHRTAAGLAVVELATVGLLDGVGLGRQVRALLQTGQVVGSRVAGALDDAGRALGPASGPVLDALVEVLPVLPGRRDGHLFAGAVADRAQLLARHVVLPEDLARLAEGRTQTALARGVRRIPRSR